MEHGDDFVVYKSTQKIKTINARYVREGIDTVHKIFQDAVQRHGNQRALGTRQVLAVEDELQSDGKSFKKV